MPGKKSLTELSKHVDKSLYRKNKTKTASVDSTACDVKPNMKSKKGNSTSKTTVNATIDLDAEGATEYLNSKEIDGEAVLDVECGPNKALMYISKLCQGSKGPCVSFKGSWLTPNEFQYVSGRETAKDWKRSIRHQGKSIKLLFSKGIIVINSGTQRKEKASKKKAGGKRRLRRLSTLVSLETSRDEITESQDSGSSDSINDSGSSDSIKSNDENTTEKPSNVRTNKTNDTDQCPELSDEEGLDTQSDSTENYELDGMDTSTEMEQSIVNMNGDDSSKQALSDCEKDSLVIKTEENEIIESEPTIEPLPKEEQTSENTNELASNDTEMEIGSDPVSDIEEKCSDEPEEERVNQKILIETVSESPPFTDLSEKPENQNTASDIDNVSYLENHIHVEEAKKETKRPSPARESKLGNIIDQLRVSKEKITQEPLSDAVSLASGPDQELPPFQTVPESCTKCMKSNQTENCPGEQAEDDNSVESSKGHESSTRVITTTPDVSCSRSAYDVVKSEHHSRTREAPKNIDSQKISIKQEAKENIEKTVCNEYDTFYNHSKQKEIVLKSKHKPSAEDCPSKSRSADKLPSLAPIPEKLCGMSVDKDYNTYMKLLAAKQEHSPFMIPPPLHDPYFSLWNPEIPFSSGLFSPYMCFGQSGLPSGLGKQSSPSLPPAFFPYPPSSLPFLTQPRSPYALPYPILDSPVPHSSPKESPTLPHSGHPPSKKRGSAETDNACALDLSTKRVRLDSNKNSILSHPMSRSTDAEKYKNSVLDLKYRSKKSTEERHHHHKHSHSDILRHSKTLKAWTEAEGKEIPKKCACGADNTDNIMNWSVDKVYNFVSKLEGCSSYAKTFRDNRIEGKTLPLLTTDTLIRNLGLKVGPAIILSEAVTRHVQDMSRFFHPCSYCKMKSSQRLTV